MVSGMKFIAPTSVLDEWKLNEEISAHICTVVREDAFQLFGFGSASQKTTFETLRGVNKIGAKLALTILSHLDVNQLATAIQTKNAATLSSVPGIGKKTAERMCLELKDKIVGEMVFPQAGTGGSTIIPRIKKEDPLQLALAQLDYRKSEIDVALKSDSVPHMESASLQKRLSAALRVSPPISNPPILHPLYPTPNRDTMTTRIVDPHESIHTEDPALRPRNLDEYIGQSAVVDNLKVYIQAAKKRGDAMDHVLLAGPPGLG